MIERIRMEAGAVGLEGRDWSDIPDRPEIGNTWALQPLAAWRRGLMLAAELLLRLAGEHSLNLDQLRRRRLRHHEVYTFSGGGWRVQAWWGEGWNYISADGRSMGWSLEWPSRFLVQFAAGDVGQQRKTTETPQAASRS
jgi:hypothetical protein